MTNIKKINEFQVGDTGIIFRIYESEEYEISVQDMGDIELKFIMARPIKEDLPDMTFNYGDVSSFSMPGPGWPTEMLAKIGASLIAASKTADYIRDNFEKM